jgi:L-aspartate oxidase
MWGIGNPFDKISCDFLVVGAGVAGLRAAISLAGAGRVLVVAKDSLRESNSEYAQGGIAVALSDDDEVELHEADTLSAGDGLCNPAAVRTLVEEGPRAIEELIEWGAEFDREGNRLLFAREGAHSRNRVLHAHGDSTGQEIARTLYQKAASLKNVEFHSFAAVIDLLVSDGRVCGAVALDENAKRLLHIEARSVLLATGGLGRVFLDTTNPEVATGDGVAAAWRAGAEVSDLEFVQFHPTALHIEGAPRFLLSEALRGEGALLLNNAGERFMHRYHPMAELAPRDVVSRSIMAEMEREGTRHVWLDLSGRAGSFVAKRFPRIHTTCLAYGIDLDRQPAPVHPAAHYAMGGVRAGLDGRTSLEGLYAAGEAACNGVHGANRLASNSLLEGVVFGARAGEAMKGAGLLPARGAQAPPFTAPETTPYAIRLLASSRIGLLREAEGLESALETLATDRWSLAMPARDTAALRNLHTVAWLMARLALARKESRGSHRRIDYPETSDSFRKHSILRPGTNEVLFE